jgi:hypothetical protein
MNDLAFIRLKPTLSEALETRQSAYAKLNYFFQIQLSTTGVYSQITNSKTNIAFDGNYSVYVCDLCGTELLDITAKVQITEFTDNRGLQQIYFTIDDVGTDFYKQPLTLRFKHTVSDYVWYTNPITISDRDLEQTTMFVYRDYKEFNGIAYNRVNNYQSIRLSCAFIGNDTESASSEYTTLDGLKVNSRLIKTEFEKYFFPGIDNFTYRRLNCLLTHPVIYVNDYRVTNKQTIPAEDFTGATNITDVEFKIAMNYNETLSNILHPDDFINTDWNNNDFLTN